MPRRTQRRAPQGAGAIFQRPNGSWQGQVTVRDDDGARHRKTVTAETQTELLRRLADLQDRLRDTVAYSPHVLFGKFLEDWLTDIIKPTRRPSTVDLYERLIRVHVRSAGRLPATPIDRVTTMQLQRFFNQLRSEKGLSASTANRVREMLSGAFRHAKRLKLVSENPVSETVPQPKNDPEVDPWTREEMGRFLEAAERDEKGVIFLLLVTTGLRRGEVLGLREQDVDLDEGLLHIRGALTYTKSTGVVWGPTKTRASRRTIAIPNLVVPHLVNWRQRRERWRRLQGDDWQATGFFFTTQQGTPVRPDNFRRTFARISSSAGLRPMKLHGTRHFWATQQLLARENPRVVQAQLGHSRVEVTLNIYSHVGVIERESMNRVADRLLPGLTIRTRSVDSEEDVTSSVDVSMPPVVARYSIDGPRLSSDA